MKASLRFRIWRRDGFRCTYCGADALVDDIRLEVDHMIPVTAGGTDDPSNLTTACRRCNWSKGPHHPRIAEGARRVMFSLPAWMHAALTLRAQGSGVSRPTLTRRLLAEAFEREDASEARAS